MGWKNWETPPEFFRKLDEEFHFTLDAAASHENALCERYCTPDGTFIKNLPTVDIRNEGPAPACWSRLSELDGLGFEWNGKRVFCNPPYDSSIGQWVDKALRREAEVTVLLLPPSVDTKWFHQLHSEVKGRTHAVTIEHGGKWWRGDSSPQMEVLFMEGRLRFYRDGKPGDAPRAGNLLVVVRR